LLQAGPDLAPLLLHSAAGAAAEPQRDAAALAWRKADAYYYGSIARLQRLTEVRKPSCSCAELSKQPRSPSVLDAHRCRYLLPHLCLQAAKLATPDLSGAEVEAGCHLSEHLLYLCQQGRGVLGGTARCFARLDKLHSVLRGSLGGGLPRQGARARLYQARQEALAALADLTAQTSELLSATADAETAAQPRRELTEAAATLAAVLARLQGICAQLAAAADASVVLPTGDLLFTTAMEGAAGAASAMLEAAHAELASSPHAGAPGWLPLLAAYHHAASAPADAPPAEAEALPGAGADAARHVADSVEAMVATALVWAQGVQLAAAPSPAAAAPAGEEGADDDDDGSEVLPEVMRAAEQRLGLPRVEQLLTQCLSAFAGLAALADCQDGAATAAAAAALRAFAPMLGLLRCGLWQHGARYLGLHRAAAKLSYVTSALFAGLVEEGFCVADAEGAQPCNITPCPRCSLFRPAVSRMLPFSHPRALLPAPRSSRLRRGRAPGRRGQDHRGHWPGRGRHARRQGHHRPAGGPGPAAWRPAEGAGGGEEGGGGAGRPGGPGRQGRRDGRRLRGRAGGRARGPAGRRGCAPFFPSACSSGMLSMCARRLD
jgi:hypothetical protein